MRSTRIVLALLLSTLAVTSSASAQLMNKSVDVNGVTREYLMYLPAGYTGAVDFPVLLVYHGGGMTPSSMLAMTQMQPMADDEDFILVYPQGLPEEPGGALIWNSEGPFSNGVDEIGFTSAMIDDLGAQFAVDLGRVYACGYSNGGNVVWELACFLSDRIAAVGAVAGSMWTWIEPMCTPERPVPVMSIHGTLDFYNPWGGNNFSMGLIAASDYWVANANANPTPAIVSLPDIDPTDGSTVEHYAWTDGDECVSIEHFKVVDGGHDWPGKFGNMDIDANTEIWNFVSRYSLNGRIGCAATYCTAGVSASGCQATLSAGGSASASAATGFFLSAVDVEGDKDGLFFFGTNGRQANPWGSSSSYQCVTPPVSRAGLLSGTGTNGLCDGAFSQDLNARWTAKPGQNPGSGATVQGQLWYRDPQNTSNRTTSLSDAIEFTVGP